MENQKEIWKDVKGYEGLYQVSSFGRVRSLHKKNNIIVLKSANKGLYLAITLCKNGGQKQECIHTIVAKHFLNHNPNGFNGLIINHKDFNKHNNSKNNLELVTPRENSNRKHIKSTSKFTGVSLDKKNGKWLSTIYAYGRHYYLGRFDNEEEAALYYEDAIIAVKNNKTIKVKRKQFSSKFKGVSWDKNKREWLSQITINKKSKYIGHYKNEFEAYIAYENKLKEITQKLKTCSL